MNECTFQTEMAKLCLIALPHPYCRHLPLNVNVYVFMGISHSGISFLVVYSSESVRNVAVMRHQLSGSLGINVLRPV